MGDKKYKARSCSQRIYNLVELITRLIQTTQDQMIAYKKKNKHYREINRLIGSECIIELGA